MIDFPMRIEMKNVPFCSWFSSARLTNIPTGPTEIRIKTQAELIDEMRENVFDMLDRMTQKKEELAEKSVPLSVCTQLQQAIRDTEVTDLILSFVRSIAELPDLDGHPQNQEAERNVDQRIESSRNENSKEDRVSRSE